MKILVSDAMSSQGLKALRSEKGLRVFFKPGLSRERLQKELSDADGLIVRSQTKVTRELLRGARKLKVIGRAGEGVDNIDVSAATELGIIVMNTPGVNTVSAAEHTFSMLLSLSRNIPEASWTLKQGRWERSRFMGVEVLGKTLGVLGFGKIGQEVAKRALSFGMKVTAYDPYLQEQTAGKLGVRPISFKALLSESDYITVHTPLSSETHHLLSRKEFALMKRGVRIINCARGGILDEQALFQAIKSGKVAGAALDVFEKEPPVGSPLLTLPQVVATPHLGASTEEAQEKVAVEIVKEVIDALKGKALRGAVNMPSLDMENFRQLKPYLLMAERLGTFHAQMVQGPIKEAQLDYTGEVIQENSKPISAAFLKGLFETIVPDTVNYVNSPYLARSRGVKVLESRLSSAEAISGYADLLTTKVTGKGKPQILSATLFAQKEPRLVQVGDFHIDATLSGVLLLCYHKDVPGMIGKIGTVLGRHRVNIASLHNGRRSIGGVALTTLSIDGAVSKKVNFELLSFPEMKHVKMVQL